MRPVKAWAGVTQLRRISLPVALRLLMAGVVPGVAGDTASEYRIKAAFLINFAHFVEWPATAFASGDAPLVFGLFGRDPFDGELDRIANGKTINGRPLLVRRVSSPSELRSCHVVFFPAAEVSGYPEAAAGLAGLPVLTVGEMSGFMKRGGMIGFVIVDGYVRFEINPSAATTGPLKVSSKLLQLAIIAGRAPRGK
jgi:uncharacterized protein DUF4154